eukprot:3862924-Prymnesium_polylepis.1
MGPRGARRSERERGGRGYERGGRTPPRHAAKCTGCGPRVRMRARAGRAGGGAQPTCRGDCGARGGGRGAGDGAGGGG